MRVPRQLAAIGFNRRPLHWQDFESLCLREKIVLLVTPMPRNGCYTVIRGYPCIALDEKLSPTELLITAWHEMGHHFLHAPDLHLYGHPNKSKAEYQAHVISACALIPQQVIRRHTFADIEEAYNLPHDLVLFRARVWQTLRM